MTNTANEIYKSFTKEERQQIRKWLRMNIRNQQANVTDAIKNIAQLHYSDQQAVLKRIAGESAAA